MKRGILLLLVIFPAFFIAECMKNPVESLTENETEEALLYITDMDAVSQEIETMEVSALEDSTKEGPWKHLKRAVRRLEFLLVQIAPRVRRSDNEEAKSYYEQAMKEYNAALNAILEEKYEAAIGHIRESRHLAVDAIRILRKELRERREELIEKLKEEVLVVEALIQEARIALEGKENEQARKAFDKAVYHFELAGKAMQDLAPRRAAFHLHEAKRLANRVLKILSPEESSWFS